MACEVSARSRAGTSRVSADGIEQGSVLVYIGAALGCEAAPSLVLPPRKFKRSPKLWYSSRRLHLTHGLSAKERKGAGGGGRHRSFSRLSWNSSFSTTSESIAASIPTPIPLVLRLLVALGFLDFIILGLFASWLPVRARRGCARSAPAEQLWQR